MLDEFLAGVFRSNCGKDLSGALVVIEKLGLACFCLFALFQFLNRTAIVNDLISAHSLICAPL